MAPFNHVALWCSVPVALVGFIFMAKCKVVFVEAFSLPAFKGVGAAPEVGGLLAHFAFILGMVAWCGFGMTSLALALGLPPAAAITPGFTGLVSVLAYMAAVGSGITGVPGITGPPMPARVINGAIAIVLNVNVVCLVAEIFWVCGLSFAMFFPLKKFGLLRVSAEIEAAGMDVSKHGGSAYEGA